MFYVLKYSEGGMSRSQIEQFYEDAQEEEYEKLKMQARMQGINVDGQKNGGEATSVESASIENSNVYNYGERESFTGWTEEEKEAATNAQIAQLMGVNIGTSS